MGAYLSAPKTEKKTQEGQNSRYSFGVSSMQGWRMSMEDAHLTNLNIDHNVACFGVFDGHGGHEVSTFVSRHFATELVLNPEYKRGNLEEALRLTFLRMDTLLRNKEGQKEVFRLQRSLPDDAPVDDLTLTRNGCCAGTTAVVCLMKDTQSYIANAGDSRCILARAGRAIELTEDHKPNNEEELQRILKAGGNVSEGRVCGNLNLSRSIGDLSYKENRGLSPEEQIITANPDVRSCTLTAEDDFIVLACDGIWDILTSQQCVEFVYERLGRMSLGKICEEMCDRCLAESVAANEGKGCDNMTVIIVTWNKSS